MVMFEEKFVLALLIIAVLTIVSRSLLIHLPNKGVKLDES